MRYLILSDIHGNFDALQAVLRDAAGRYEEIVNCGDLVGYGPNPAEVARFCRQRCKYTVRGNHDKAVGGVGAALRSFNPLAQEAVRWTRDAMGSEELDYVRSLPRGPQEIEDFSIMHGAAADEDEYVVTAPEAALAATACPTPTGFFGHTHLQCAFHVNRHGARPVAGAALELAGGGTYLINPGSVGQPRDGDPRAAYALYDSRRKFVEFCRVTYDIDAVYEKIRKAGLPQTLGARLYSGS